MRIQHLDQHVNFQPEKFGRSVVFSTDTAAQFMYTFQPGQAMTEHTHPFSAEYLMVLEGEAQISVGTESVLAEVNSVVLVLPEEVHAIHNHGSEPLVVLSFMSPKP
ncbi:MAG: cupin domain-containing protein [Candidatus Firestonebacteria bacterium]|nr:cupin domain-containing protein [Candidatus Firestonebacteria bacterium]